MDDSVVKVEHICSKNNSMLYTHSRVYNKSNKTNTNHFR